jgi:hypothetical protein
VRLLVVDMVGMVGVWVCGVVCLVSVRVWRVWSDCVWRAGSDSGEVGCWVREGVRWGFGSVGEKNFITL